MQAARSTIGVAVVDDHPVMCQGISAVVRAQRDMRVVGVYHDAPSAQCGIAQGQPTVAVVDIMLGRRSGLDLVRVLNTHHPSLGVLVYSLHAEHLYAELALKAGARGYVMKNEPPERLVYAIRMVAQGKIVLSEPVQQHWLQQQVGHARPARQTMDAPRFSVREQEVFLLLGQGLRIGRIARQLGISARTVETHVQHLRHKLGAASTLEVAQRAYAAVQTGDAPPNHARPVASGAV